jgi:hypothetical protein
MVAYSNFANNLFASACDNLRPIIAFGTCHSLPNALELLSLPTEVKVSMTHRTGKFRWN